MARHNMNLWLIPALVATLPFCIYSQYRMKKLFFIILASFLNIYAQKCGDTISLKGNWFTGYKYSYHCSEYNNVAGLFTIINDFNNIISINHIKE